MKPELTDRESTASVRGAKDANPSWEVLVSNGIFQCLGYLNSKTDGPGVAFYDCYLIMDQKATDSIFMLLSS